MSERVEIVARIDAAIAVHERELLRLRAGRMALADDESTAIEPVAVEKPAAPVRANPVPAPVSKPRRVPGKLTGEAVEAAARSLLAAEGIVVTLTEVGRAAGLKSNPSPSAKATIERGLRRIGARRIRTGRGGSVLWGIPAPAPDLPAPIAAPVSVAPSNGDAHIAAETDRAYLERALLRELRKGPLVPVVVAERIDAPISEVELACERMAKSGSLSQMGDGSYVA